MSLNELECKIAAFFELLDEWRRAEDVVFFWPYWMPRLLHSRGHPVFGRSALSFLGGSCGGGRRGHSLFT